MAGHPDGQVPVGPVQVENLNGTSAAVVVFGGKTLSSDAVAAGQPIQNGVCRDIAVAYRFPRQMP